MYEDGLAFAFLLWAYSVVSSIIQINSRFERNLNQIGQCLSWVTFTPRPMSASDYTRKWPMSCLKFAVIQCIGLVLALTSWLYVALFLWSIASRIWNDRGAPPAVKELRWKLRNLDMTFDDVAEAFFKAGAKEGVDLDQFKFELREELREQRGY